MPATFGPERRLRRRADFLRVQAIGQRASTAHFILLVAAREGDAGGCARIGLVASKKIGNAVERNRVKRLCRECFRTWPDLVPDGVDLVVIARGNAAELGLAEVRAEWQRARPALLERCASVLTTGARK